MQTQIQRMGGMSSAVIGGFCEHSPVVHKLVAKFADMTAKETAKERGWQSAQRCHSSIYQRHRIRQRLATGQRHGATSTKTKSRACPTWTPAPSTHARFATCKRRTRGGEQRNPEHSRTPLALAWDLGRREWAAQQGATGPLAASPRPRSPGCGRAAGTPQRERFAHGRGQRPHSCGHT
jgi:hypothetical protein